MLSPLFGSWKQPWACLLFSSTVFNMGHYYLYYYNYYFQHWAGTGTIPTEETCRQTPLVFCLDYIWEAKSFNSWQWKWQLKPTNRNIISLILIQTINNCPPLYNFLRKWNFILRPLVKMTAYKGRRVKTQELGSGPVSANGIHSLMFILYFETCYTVGGCSEQ